MNAALLAAFMVVLGATLAVLGTARARRGPVLIVLQLVCAVLLWFVLSPPLQDAGGERMLVLTGGAGVPDAALRADAARVVALPGADADPSIERVPDLGTALRRHPRTTRVHIVGGGLSLRDREQVGALALDFSAGPLPRGVAEVALPSSITAGSIWRLGGRVSAVDGGRVELLDRAGGTIAKAILDGEGRFALDVRAKGAGSAVYTLRVLDAGEAMVEDLPVAVVVQPGDGVRAMLVAGAPDAELKYLRRWAVDTGIELDSRMALSRGIALRDGEPRLDAARLAESDLLIVDERSWGTLARSEKQAIADAVDDGLGLLLRVTGPLPAAVADEWNALGVRIAAADIAQGVELGPPADGRTAAVAVTRRPITVDVRDGRTLVAASNDSALAAWRAQGRGRIALWWLLDSHRLVLRGDAQRFGSLWSDALRTIARARAEPAPDLPSLARVDRRSAVCGIADGAVVEDPARNAVPLAPDPGSPGCAAFWPSESGWHTLVDGATRRPFHVLARGQGETIERTQTRDATLALASASTAPAPTNQRMPGPRWPWFLAWLAIATLLWWLERRPPAPGADRTP